MEIGIFDQDLLLYPKRAYPNLEAMKVASFHKDNRDIVRLVLNANEIVRFRKFYVFKNIKDKYFPKKLISNPNTEFYGLAFTNNIYTPMPEAIEKATPDTLLYRRYYNENMPELVKKVAQKTWFEADLLRLYPDGTYWEPKLTLSNRAIIYDQNVGKYSNYKEVISYLTSEKKKIYFCLPQVFNDLNAVIYYGRTLRIAQSSMIGYSGPLNKDSLAHLVEESVPFNRKIYVNFFHKVERNFESKLLTLYLEEIINMIFYVKTAVKTNNISVQLRNAEGWPQYVRDFMYFLNIFMKNDFESLNSLLKQYRDENIIVMAEILFSLSKNIRLLFDVNIPKYRETQGAWKYD